MEIDNIDRALQPTLTTFLDEGHSEEWLRLNRALKGSRGGSLFFIVYNHRQLRDEILNKLYEDWNPVANLSLAETDSEYSDFEARLAEFSKDESAIDYRLIQILDWDKMSPPSKKHFRQNINQRREVLFKLFPCPVMIWLYEEDLKQFAKESPDTWAWRKGVFIFKKQLHQPSTEVSYENYESWEKDATQNLKRRDELNIALAGPIQNQRLKIRLLREVAHLNIKSGETQTAETQFEEAYNIAEEIDDIYYKGLVSVDLADLLFIRGEMDSALDRLQTAVVIFTELKENRELANVKGQIVDILQSRGQLEEALKILTEQVIPVFEKLGDVHSRALTMGQIADILQSRGQLEEALKILTEQVIPVFEKLGDVRSRAVTMGQIADILQSRGQLEEALKIRTEQQIPVFEKLGDVRSRAVAMGKIADIMERRGQFEEALKILTEQVIPVLEKLGDVRSRAVAMGKIADIMERRGQLEEALKILTEQVIPVLEKLGYKDGIAAAYFKTGLLQLHDPSTNIQGKKQARSRILLSYQMFLQLGRLDGISVVGYMAGQILLANGQLEEAKTVFKRSISGFRKLGWEEDARETEKLLLSIS